MLKKSLSVLLSICLLVALVACGGGDNDQESVFLTKINESFVNMMRVEATFLTYKVQKLDTAKVSSLGAYSAKKDEVFNEAKTASLEYLTVIENNHSSVVSLYNDLLNSSNTSESLKTVAKEMYNDYEYMYECVTEDLMLYLSWYKNFPDVVKSFDNSMTTYKNIYYNK